ncbi:MAG TPA: serine/threonine-protein kinase, partial [Candidatus Obscuribacterales bacterium]
ALEHPNVVQVHDSGITEDGRPYLVMSYIEGRSLGEILEEEDRLEPERAIRIFSQVCDALAHAHHKGVVHRDLKPNNIMLVKTEASTDVVKIVDFGIAKLVAPDGTDTQTLTRTGETFGSPWYMSPEQCLAQRLDSRSDIYSLGCVMYHALTGKPPLAGESAFETMTFHVSKKPRPFKSVRPDLGVQPELERVVRVAMEKIPEERWQSMTEFRDQLLGASRHEGVRTMGVATQRMSVAGRKPRGSKARMIKTLLLIPALVIIFAEVFKPGSVQRVATDGMRVCERLWERVVKR